MGDKSPLTYDDIELYTRVRLDGKEGWVLDKGEHIVEEVKDGRHLYIEYIDDVDDDYCRLHENLVNKHLDLRERLWVDWDDRLNPATETRHDAIA